MTRGPQHRHCARNHAARVNQFRRVQQVAAAVALVAARVFVAALGARAADETVGEELAER